MPLTVEILLSVYNGEKYLPQLLESLDKQSYPDIRLLVRDDGSSDSSTAIVEDFINRTRISSRLIRSGGNPPKGNLGAIGSFNCLMEESTADYVMFCDQDDVWLPAKVEKSLLAMKKAEEKHGKLTPILVHCDLKVADEDLNLLAPSMWRFQGLDARRGRTLNRMLVQNTATGCATIINRALVEKVPHVPEGAIMHDWYLALAAAACGKVETLDEPLILYRQHSDNAIGALRYSISSSYKRVSDEGAGGIKWRIRRTFVQAKAFSENMQKLSPEAAGILKEYLMIPESPFLKRRLSLIQNDFLKNGLLRNIGLFIYI